MKNPHHQAYLEGKGILGDGNLKPKLKQYVCPSCNKRINKKDLFVANDAGKRFHLSCCMRSQEDYDEASI